MMNKFLSAILILSLAGISMNGLADDDDDDDDETKVTICHKNNKTKSVGASALAAHLNHGDLVGSCEDAQDSNDSYSTVVMMHCEADGGEVKITAFSSSVVFAVPPLSDAGVGSDCANTMSSLFVEGFQLKSVTGETDYLLLGDSSD